MARLREGIHLRSYANVNPLQDYVNEGYRMFKENLEIASVDAVLNLLNVKVEPKEKEENPSDIVDVQQPTINNPKQPDSADTGEGK
jgi:preprotein translocase subunit SecA